MNKNSASCRSTPSTPVERIWFLLGRKLANEITPAELQEFQKLLNDDEEIRYQVALLTHIWYTGKK